MSVFPLNLENKEDHPDKVAKLENVPSRFYVTAQEINTKKDALIELYDLFKSLEAEKPATIPIKARQYQIHKHLNNTDPAKKAIRQNNDFVYNVQWSATEFWGMAQCIDETLSADNELAWEVYGKIEPLPII